MRFQSFPIFRVPTFAFVLSLLFPSIPVRAQILPQVKTVFVIAMENHNFTQPTPTASPQQILYNSAAPYINSLISAGNSNAVQVSYSTHHYNAGIGVHPSEPNYVWAEAGTDFGIHTDNDPSAASANIFTSPHLTKQLNTAGISWKNYQEDVQLSSGPTHSASGTSATVINPYYSTGQYNYAAKHNPMVFFSDTQTQNVYPLTQFSTDLAYHTFGRYNWITPNQFNDQHSALSGGFAYRGVAYTGDQAAIAQGDNFLSILIPQIMATPEYLDHGVIIIRWDESEIGDNTSYTIPEILISPLARGNAFASSLEVSHSSDIKTMEQIFGLAYLSNAIPAGETKASGSGYNNVALVNDLSDLFQQVPGLIVQQPAGVRLTNGVSAVLFGTVNIGNSVTNFFTITNWGKATLNLTNVTVTGGNASEFIVAGLTLPSSVPAGASATFKVLFSPSVCGAASATLQITDNDVSNNPFTVALAATGNSAPAISSQPQSLSTNQGSNVSFSVSAAACTTLRYQWYFGTNPVPAGTNSTLNISSVVPADAGDYYVSVSSTGGLTNSDLAHLQVILPPPLVLGWKVLTNGSFQLNCPGPSGQSYQVLATDDLALSPPTWMVLTNGTFSPDNAVFTDDDATNHTQRFYKIKSP
jgi:hypothetical protein